MSYGLLFSIFTSLCFLLPGMLAAQESGGESASGENAREKSAEIVSAARLADSIVRVNVTTQGFNFSRPWDRGQPRSQTAVVPIIEGGRVLVLGEMVANHTYVELEDLVGGNKAPARVETVDYEANLATVKPVDPKFLKDYTPLPLADEVRLGDILRVVQVQNNGNISPASGPVTSVDITRYSPNNSFMVYRLNTSLQYRLGNSTLPVVSGNALVGLMKRYNADQQTLDVIPPPIIRHFLKEAEDGEYQGFPLSGITIMPMRDPQLRQYIEMPEDETGVYIGKVTGGRPGKEAGLRAGDVILEIAGKTIDDRGNYTHPLHGQISLSHLIRAEHYVGDTVTFKLLRDGEITEVPVTLDHRPTRDYLVPPMVVDDPPRYLVAGGLIIQELTLPYLRQFGGRWPVAAPTDLVYYQQNQDDLEDEDRDKIIFISAVIPSEYTIGYTGLGNAVISKINGQEIGKLEDVRAALENPLDGFHKIEVENDPYTIYLDAQQMPQVNEALKQLYRLPALRNL
jgi:S1-C subfamily serine protease